jgi:AcrR family transcriptional regulator
MARAGVGPDAIVAEAARIADANGLAAVTLTRLAESLRVKPPSLYAHVSGLDDVQRRLGARGLTQLAAELGRAIEGRAGTVALRALAAAYRDFARRHPGMYAATQRSRELADDEDAKAAGDAVVRVALAVLLEYDLDGDDAIHAVRIMRIALHGFVSLEAVGGFAMAQSFDETFERLVALLDFGLRAGLRADDLPSAGT